MTFIKFWGKVFLLLYESYIICFYDLGVPLNTITECTVIVFKKMCHKNKIPFKNNEIRRKFKKIDSSVLGRPPRDVNGATLEVTLWGQPFA